jgi:putative transport protein
MNELLVQNPLLLLFLVSAIGYLIGKIRIGGTGLGTSAVLFVGLLFGALNTEFHVPEILFQLGLVFFVYSVGLQSGPAFFQSFKKNGWRDFHFVFWMLSLSALLAVLIFFITDIDAASIVGVYCGSSTNTPALASAIDLAGQLHKDAGSYVQHMAVGYTFSYPMGVLGVMIAIKFMQKILKIDFIKEKELLRKEYPLDEDLTSRTIEITNPEISQFQLRDLLKNYQWNVVFGRLDSVKYGTVLSNWDIHLEPGDKLIVVGTHEDIDAVQAVLGKEAEESLLYDRKEYDIVRIFVSNPDLVGKTLSSLNLHEKFNAIITRIRRGDIEMLAKSDTILELGDRIRFVAKRKDIKEIQKLFGDSYYASNKIDIFSFGLGIGMGLMLGMMEFVLPGGMVFKFGIAGGPLIMGLILGSLRRTGPIVWTLPYGSNITLNQIGLTLLLAVIGIKSGNTLLKSLSGGEWIPMFMSGTVISIAGAVMSLWIGYKIFKIPYSLLMGFVANQPAILEFSNDITKNRVPTIGYAFMFPISVVMKILYAQLLFLLLQ